MTAAQAAGDPAAELDAIRARVAALSAPQHRTEWLRLGARTVELAAATGQPIAAVLGRVWRIDASYQLMNLEAVDTEIALIAQLAESTRLPLARWHLLRQQASRAALAGQFITARDRSEEARQLAVRIQDLSGTGMSYAFALSLASHPRRCHRDSSRISSTSWRTAPPIPVIRASQAAALFATGRADEARAVYETLRQLPAAGDRDVRTFGSLIQLIDLIIAFRDTDTAQATYDLFHPLAAHGRYRRLRAGEPARLGALAARPAGGAARPHRAGAGPLRLGPGGEHPARRPAIRRRDQAGLGHDAGRTCGRR